jgi:uncharacterized protein YhfF
MIESRSAEVKAFWEKFCKETKVPRATPFHARTFSDPALSHVTDEIAGLAEQGRKRGTAHLLLDFEKNGVPQRKPGDYLVVLDAALAPRCVVRCTRIDVRPFNRVSETFAASEGEGDLSLAFWRDGHRSYFEKQLRGWGMAWDDSLPVVCESFELVWPKPAGEAG